MRPSLWVVSVLLGASLLGGQQRTQSTDDLCTIEQADPYSLEVVGSGFQLTQFVHAYGFWKSVLFSSPTRKALPQLGDGASVAILKIVSPKELASSKPQTIMGYLQVIYFAFSSPEIILREADRDPKVTLFLLDYLDERAPPNAAVQREIASVRQYVYKQTNHPPLASPSNR